jgi:hypothetical protein
MADPVSVLKRPAPLISISSDKVEQVDALTFHTSPPPSLTARFNMANLASISMTGDEEARASYDSMRTLPGELKDPRGTLHRVSLHAAIGLMSQLTW